MGQIFILLFLICSVNCIPFPYDLAADIRKFMNIIESPMSLSAMTCWNYDFKVNFIKGFTTESEPSDRDCQYQITSDRMEFFPFIQEQHQLLILIDLSCDNSTQLLDQIPDQFYQTYKWLFIRTETDEKTDEELDFLEIFQHLPILPSSSIFYLYQNDNGTLIKQAYKIAPGEPLIIENVGALIENTFLDYRPKESVVFRRRNLNGLHLKASMVITNNDSLHHLTDYKNKHIDTITKVNYFLTNYLAAFVNATVTYSIVNSWGYRDADTAVWSGMIGELVRNEADIGASPLFFTVDRVNVIEYIAMPSATGSRFIFRSPKLSFTNNLFLLPFDEFLWVCLVALILVTAIFLILATCFEWKIPLVESIDETDPSILRPSVGEIFMLVFAATVQQGSASVPRSTTARLIMFVICLTLMFLYNSYSANIVALLQSPSTKIKTLEDLLNSRLKFGVDDTVFNHYYFSHATEPIRKAIYEQKILRKDKTANFLDINDGVKRIREGLYAFHMEPGVGYKLISETFYEYEKCGLHEIKYLEVIDPWYAIRKNSSYRELLKTGMMRIHEYGLQNRENSRLYTKKPTCFAGGNFVTVSLVDTRPALMILVWGGALALLAFIAELIVHHFKTKRHKLKHIEFRL